MTHGSWRLSLIGRVTAGVTLCLLLPLAACTSDNGVADPAAPPSDARCHGITHDEVLGHPPSYASSRLPEHPLRDAVCAAYWIQQAEQDFVPQGLAVRERTAYVSGYRWVKGHSRRACQVARIDLRTGSTAGFTARVEASVYGPRMTYCRHGGGLEITGDGLWLAEAERLWLLDPALIGVSDPVLRVWRVERGIKGSTLVIKGDHLGLGEYNSEGRGRIWWFDLDDVRRPGVDDLRRVVGDSTDAGLRSTGSVPGRLQGIAAGPGGVWHSSSRLVCGVLRGPNDQEVGSVPGAEDVQFVGRDLWVVSEAGAKPYADFDAMPMLLRMDRRAVLGSRSTCDF